MIDPDCNYLGEECRGGNDGLMHYTHTTAGVWCTDAVDVRGPFLSRRYAVVTCFWCLVLIDVDDA